MIKTIIIVIAAVTVAFVLFTNPELSDKMIELAYKLFISILKAVAGFVVETVKALL